jgi:hypothetical protein
VTNVGTRWISYAQITFEPQRTTSGSFALTKAVGISFNFLLMVNRFTKGRTTVHKVTSPALTNAVEIRQNVLNRSQDPSPRGRSTVGVLPFSDLQVRMEMHRSLTAIIVSGPLLPAAAPTAPDKSWQQRELRRSAEFKLNPNILRAT